MQYETKTHKIHTGTSDWVSSASVTVCGLRVEKPRGQFLIDADHCYFDDVCSRTLHSRVDSLSFRLTNKQHSVE